MIQNYEPHAQKTIRVFVIAGEHSGDRLGADIIKQCENTGQSIEFHGIGGPLMARQGLKSIFPLEDIAVMGLTEIIPKLPLIYARLKVTQQAIKEFSPDIVLSIDCPDFSLRVQKRLKKEDVPGKRVHYVAPTVWAWRPNRAKKIACYLDHICCLYPFEPDYFRAHGLDASFVGHPIARYNFPNLDKQSFVRKYNIPADSKLIGLYPGSRGAEIKNNVSALLDAARELKKRDPLYHFIVPGFTRFKERIFKKADGLREFLTYLEDEETKYGAMPLLDAAIAVNGTVGLELAMAKVPHIICYKAPWLTYQIARRLVKIDHIHLINILADHQSLAPEYNNIEIVPEFIQADIKVMSMVERIENLMNTKSAWQKQLDAFSQARKKMQSPQKSVSEVLEDVS